MVVFKSILLITLTFSASIYGSKAKPDAKPKLGFKPKSNSQNVKIIEGGDDNLPTYESNLYNSLIREAPITRFQSKYSFEDLFSDDERIAVKRLFRPCNITIVTIENLLINYKYSALPACSEELVLSENRICSKTFDPVIGTVIVAYRGTNSLKNWEINFDFDLVQYPGAKKGALVHKTFYEATLALQKNSKKPVCSLLKDPNYKGYKLQVTVIFLDATLFTVSSLR